MYGPNCSEWFIAMEVSRTHDTSQFVIFISDDLGVEDAIFNRCIFNIGV